MQTIPVFDTTKEVELLKPRFMEELEQVLLSGRFIMGERVRKFEQEVASYLHVRHAVALNSGTDALVIALRAAGVGPGDEVITTAFTFFATAEAIHQVGAAPVFVDIDPETFNIEASSVEAAVTPRTKAIVPVHLFGQCADMRIVMEIADKYRLKVVEDVAQAFGAEIGGRKAGTIGDAGCFSFFPTKNLGAYGDGGLIATNDDGIAEAARMLRAHGSKKKYYNEAFGYNSRLDEMQAAILRIKLPHIEEWNAARRAIAHRYSKVLGENNRFVVPVERSGRLHVYHQYTVRVLDGKRDELQRHLQSLGIETMVYYPVPVHKLPVYGDRPSFALPITERAADEVLSLPIWPFMERAMQDRVIEALAAFKK